MTKQQGLPQVKKFFAFTLIEILVVIAIIGILATLAMVSYSGSQKQARDTQRKSDLKQYQTALESHAGRNGGLFPVVTGSMTDVCANYLDSSCPDDPLLNDEENEYEYTYSSTNGLTYTLTASMESKEVNWIVSSDGTAGEESTSGGSSTTAPTPTATACGGCYSGTTCMVGNTTAYCGTGGEACIACSTGQSCLYGDCKEGVPTATPTPATSCLGCYNGTTCMVGNSNDFCGTGGELCDDCVKDGRVCVSGDCISPK